MEKSVSSMTIRLLTRAEFDSMQKQDSYFRGRWGYYSVVHDWICDLQFASVLELGPYKLPVTVGGDTMDRHPHVSPTYLHDATDVPWPVSDDYYDLFIALQVWEHLDDKQPEAFAEVMRIANTAILSFPLRWWCPSNPTHHNITEKKIATWTHHVEPTKRTLVGKRLIMQFDFR
jgi:hypothetical protein